ncbi:hypothetical protein [Faecalimicrobium dakarense]|uniref:hypothetical protein n=1 Tax=Faecalimicrobium dakarense TaxID=1301100 RepID=UPI0004AE37B3|nr:hypothetical protein [[Clostridium] dakarense]
MAKVLKSKYNSTGERCVDACLNYGDLRYINEDGSPINIEIPCDKYEEAVSDFEDRIREGIIQRAVETKEVLKRGAFTYNQAKNIAIDGKVRGLDFFEIDGSVECDHILGVSGSIEYALSLWNGDSTKEALLKSIIRAIKVYGEGFINGLSLDNTVDISLYTRFAKNVSTMDYMTDIKLYKARNYTIDNEVQIEGIGSKIKNMSAMNLILGLMGALIGLIFIQVATNFGKIIDNNILFLILNLLCVSIGGIIFINVPKRIIDKYVKNNTKMIMDLFNEELEIVTYDNLLTEKEAHIVLKNITKGEVSKLLMDMKGSVNKKISSNNLVSKESKFMLDARKTIVLPSEYDIKEGLNRLVGTYNEKLKTNITLILYK